MYIYITRKKHWFVYDSADNEEETQRSFLKPIKPISLLNNVKRRYVPNIIYIDYNKLNM